MKLHSICITLFFLLLAAVASAEPPTNRSPLTAMRSTRVQLTRFGRIARVVRTRTPGKTTARFVAEAGLVPEGSFLLFEAHSVSTDGYTRRWRCVAEREVEECFSAPLELRYLPRDRQIVLTVTPVSPVNTKRLALNELKWTER